MHEGSLEDPSCLRYSGTPNMKDLDISLGTSLHHKNVHICTPHLPALVRGFKAPPQSEVQTFSWEPRANEDGSLSAP